MRHRRKHLVLRVRVALSSSVLELAIVLGLQRPAEGRHGSAWRRTEGNRRDIAIVVREKSSRAMNCARDARGDRLVDVNRACAAVVRCGLVSIAGFAVPFAFAVSLSLSFLISTSHLLVLLNGAVSFVHFAISIVGCSAAAAVEALVVHACLLINESARQFFSTTKIEDKIASTLMVERQAGHEPKTSVGGADLPLTKASSGEQKRRDKKKRLTPYSKTPRPVKPYMEAGVVATDGNIDGMTTAMGKRSGQTVQPSVETCEKLLRLG